MSFENCREKVVKIRQEKRKIMNGRVCLTHLAQEPQIIQNLCQIEDDTMATRLLLKDSRKRSGQKHFPPELQFLDYQTNLVVRRELEQPLIENLYNHESISFSDKVLAWLNINKAKVLKETALSGKAAEDLLFKQSLLEMKNQRNKGKIRGMSRSNSLLSNRHSVHSTLNKTQNYVKLRWSDAPVQRMMIPRPVLRQLIMEMQPQVERDVIRRKKELLRLKREQKREERREKLARSMAKEEKKTS